MNLFQLGNFKLSSGLESHYKIDCDALTQDDLQCLAFIAYQNLPEFGSVEGVPRGGLRFAECLEKYKKAGFAPLIVDDVLTTGESMEKQKAGRKAAGVVIFSRTVVVPRWIYPIFTLTA